MVFNDRFRFHFNEPEEFWVPNKGNTAQQGDIVLLKELPETYAIDINHTVHKVKLGLIGIERYTDLSVLKPDRV